VLSVPTTVTSAIGADARRGLLFKGGEALEQLAHIRRVAFDKIGTLTRGEPQVTDTVPLGDADAGEVLTLAAEVEAASAHPLAASIVRHTSPVDAVEAGATDEEPVAHVAGLEAERKTTVVLLAGGRPLGPIALRDEPRRRAGRDFRAGAAWYREFTAHR